MTYGMYTANLPTETHVGQHLQGCASCYAASEKAFA